MTEGEIYQIPYRDILYIEKSIKENGCIIAVSYTHLDVYKRQAILILLSTRLIKMNCDIIKNGG